ncbi:MAG: HAMP domain-containing sensor histidine kinase [Alphaproteobacteria bacterium]|nr:HAMP domain-containing sensor histidine kinase [Alphaproteobacteria bacterium]
MATAIRPSLAVVVSSLGAVAACVGATGAIDLHLSLAAASPGASPIPALVAVYAALAALVAMVATALLSGRRRLGELARENLRLARDLDRAGAAGQARAELLGNMSHELRTPLNAVLGFSEVIRDETLGPALPPCYRDCAETIHDAGRHLLGIVNTALDLARIESGKAAPALCEVRPVDDVLAPIAQMLKTQSDEAGVRLDLDTPREIPPVISDAEKLKQIVLNLAANGIKYTPAGGAVTLGAGVDTANGALTIQVRDNGIGMAADEIPICLSAFGRADAAFDRGREGTGLGLHLSQRMVGELGGELAIDSTPGHGTTVTLTLPSRPSGGPAAPPG